MAIYDIDDNELWLEDVDLDLGYIAEEQRFVRHHDAIIPDPENGKFEEATAWDEYEIIQRYILYTEEELAQKRAEKAQQEKQETFIKEGPDKLDETVLNVEDIILLLAEVLGTEEEVIEEE